MANPPVIPPLKEAGSPRPFWSVMIPTYNPRSNFLEETLTSVLQQDPGPDQMQIEVVDDGSNDDTASEVTRRVGAGRVMFHHESENQGLANSWNRCVERARGDWVHILHQDDIVLPGFYDLLRKGAEESHAVAIFCRHAIANSNGHWLQLSELHRESAGQLDDWHAKITAQQLIQCAAIAVRRTVYEQLGGFLPQLHYVPDWEMWQRIASQFPVCFEPSILACYRLHSNSATSRLRLDTRSARDDRSHNDLSHPFPWSRSCQEGAVLVGGSGCFPCSRTASESRIYACLAADCRSSALVLRPAHHPKDFLVFRLVASNHGSAT